MKSPTSALAMGIARERIIKPFWLEKTFKIEFKRDSFFTIKPNIQQIFKMKCFL